MRRSGATRKAVRSVPVAMRRHSPPCFVCVARMSAPERGIMFLSKTPEPALSAAASKILKLRARIVPFGLPNPRCVPHAPSELLAQNEKNPISGSAASFQYESVGRGCLRSQLSRSPNRSQGEHGSTRTRVSTCGSLQRMSRAAAHAAYLMPTLLPVDPCKSKLIHSVAALGKCHRPLYLCVTPKSQRYLNCHLYDWTENTHCAAPPRSDAAKKEF